MYVKPSRKQVRGIYVPENYNGTAFDTEQTEQEDSSPITQTGNKAPLQTDQGEHHPELTPVATQSAIPTDKKEQGGVLASLFSGFGSLRSDDMLLLALILLLSRNDKEGHDAADVLPLLAILLFIG